MSRICVTGIWHQGAVLAACLADLGHDVRGLCDEASVAQLTEGKPIVHEPELPALLAGGIAAARLRFTADPADALDGAEYVFLSTDTPVRPDDSPDLASVYELAETIRDAIAGDTIVCVSAQVPVGTTEELGRIVGANAGGHRCAVAYVPEFLRLGDAVHAFREADRFVVGADDPDTAAGVASLFAELERPIVLTDIRSAEMAKHAANAFLATSISFMNETADLCSAVGADPLEVARMLKLDRRIGPHAYLSPGLGFAGGTLGRELRVLQRIGVEHGLSTRIASAAVEVNDARAPLVSQRLRDALHHLHGRRIAVHGLTYKAGTSTLRRAVSLDVVRGLMDAGATVVASDPLADLAELDQTPVTVCRDLHEAAAETDALVVMTDAAGSKLDLARLREVMRGDVILDARTALEPAAVRSAGFRYASLWEVDR